MRNFLPLFTMIALLLAPLARSETPLRTAERAVDMLTMLFASHKGGRMTYTNRRAAGASLLVTDIDMLEPDGSRYRIPLALFEANGPQVAVTLPEPITLHWPEIGIAAPIAVDLSNATIHLEPDTTSLNFNFDTPLLELHADPLRIRVEDNHWSGRVSLRGESPTEYRSTTGKMEMRLVAPPDGRDPFSFTMTLQGLDLTRSSSHPPLSTPAQRLEKTLSDPGQRHTDTLSARDLAIIFMPQDTSFSGPWPKIPFPAVQLSADTLQYSDRHFDARQQIELRFGPGKLARQTDSETPQASLAIHDGLRFEVIRTAPAGPDDHMPFSASIALPGISLSQNIWDDLDPATDLARTPFSLLIDFAANLRPFDDSLSSEAQLSRLDGDLTLRQLAITGLGTEIEATGAAQFDPGHDGFIAPLRRGDLIASFTGFTGLLDALAARSDVPEEILVGLRLLLGGMSNADDSAPDRRTTRARLTAQDTLTVNGMKIR